MRRPQLLPIAASWCPDARNVHAERFAHASPQHVGPVHMAVQALFQPLLDASPLAVFEHLRIERIHLGQEMLTDESQQSGGTGQNRADSTHVAGQHKSQQQAAKDADRGSADERGIRRRVLLNGNNSTAHGGPLAMGDQ